MMVVVMLIISSGNERLDGLLHRSHLQYSLSVGQYQLAHMTEDGFAYGVHQDVWVLHRERLLHLALLAVVVMFGVDVCGVRVESKCQLHEPELMSMVGDLCWWW